MVHLVHVHPNTVCVSGEIFIYALSTQFKVMAIAMHFSVKLQLLSMDINEVYISTFQGQQHIRDKGIGTNDRS